MGIGGSIHGRYTHHGNCCWDAQRAYSHDATPPWESRVHNQQQPITSNSNPRDRVPWDGSEFPDNELKAPRGKIKKIRLEALDHPNPLTRSLSITGQTKCNKPSTSDGSTALPLTTVLPKTSTGDQFSGLQLNHPVIPPGTGRSTVVGGPLIQVEQEESDNSTIIYDNNVRCLSTRVGGLCNGICTGGPWSLDEQSLHINCLELLAATLTIQTFTEG